MPVVCPTCLLVNCLDSSDVQFRRSQQSVQQPHLRLLDQKYMGAPYAAMAHVVCTRACSSSATGTLQDNSHFVVVGVRAR
jgi:hypothetical protein